ncbi:MAG: proline racemase family protein [Actinobacteria bacterium]|nr:proline racemase family protein [Actinomycetota bacterium]
MPGPGETLTSTDYHTAGEPFRIVDAGPMEGRTVLDRRTWAQQHLDDVRQFLINEPRGHADMYGGFVVPPDDGDGDLGVVFFHKDGFSTACGHGTIALVAWAVDEGVIDVPDGADLLEVVVDVPSGRLHTVARIEDGQAVSVRFRNVPAYMGATGIEVNTSFGPIEADVSFGGASYASVAIDDLPLSVTAGHIGDLVTLGREVKAALAGHGSLVHPTDDRLSGCYGTILHETPGAEPLHQRNVTIFADGQVDRSPCGSGTSARLALLYHHGVIGVGDAFHNEGIAGGVFVGRIESVTYDGSVVTTVEGSAHRHATSTFMLDPSDALGLGFQLR